MRISTEPSKTEATLILVLTFLVQIFEVSRTVGWRARATGQFDNLDNSVFVKSDPLQVRMAEPVGKLAQRGFFL
jgi:hypothetical protein